MRRSRSAPEVLAGALAAACLATPAVATDLRDRIAACAAIEDRERRLACYDALGRELPEATREEAQGSFGAEGLRAPPPTSAAAPPDTLSSRLVGPFTGWESDTRFQLENGQVWKVAGGDSAYYPGRPDGPAVTIEKGFLGTYWMAFEGVERRVKVRRIK